MLSGGQQKFYYYYFIVHIFTTVVVDSIVVVPDSFHFSKSLVDYHIKLNNDFLLYDKPTWLWWFVLVECVGQLPAFFWFVYKFRQFWALKRTAYQEKMKKAELTNCQRTLVRGLKIYGWNAALTTCFCLYKIWTDGHYPGDNYLPLETSDKLKLMAVYAPYLMIPLRLCFI
ncbi:LADA_0A06436g1_1 [Lachancea dasiensis]|uniref:Efficient mitochondria targeting-associated protein 19 n=1 Tax=Lachancea dasiensis TaxID=1072105 RepID=A0A1G4IPX2_9SACH|nr:LADA_0A06436g1_1 [Lachancea dasiensis]